MEAWNDVPTRTFGLPLIQAKRASAETGAEVTSEDSIRRIQTEDMATTSSAEAVPVPVAIPKKQLPAKSCALSNCECLPGPLINVNLCVELGRI